MRGDNFTLGFDLIHSGFIDSGLVGWVWRPIMPPGWIFTLVILTIGISLFAYWRTAKDKFFGWVFMIVRTIAITGIGVLLMGPSSIVESDDAFEKSNLYVLADISESMATEDCGSDSRLAAMKKEWFESKQYLELSKKYHPQLYGFADSMAIVGQPDSLAIAEGQSTQLVGALRRVISSITSAEKHPRVLLLSDGIDSNQGKFSTVARLAQSKGVAVDSVLFGQQSFKPDIALIAIPMQEFLFPNESGNILARVYQAGCSDERTVLTVQQGDAIEKFPVEFDGASSVNVLIPIKQEESGQFEYKISVDAVERENETRNNQQTVFATIQPRKMRVLLVVGQPFWDTKFIAQSLRKDGRLELTQVSQISARKRETIVTRAQDGKSKMPTTAEQWSEFDVVILGKNIEKMMTADSANGLVKHISETNGNIVFARGRPFDPRSIEGAALEKVLDPITPVTWTGTTMRGGNLELTLAGKISQLFAPTKMGLDVEMALERLPGFKRLEDVAIPRQSTQVLLEAKTVSISDQPESLPAIVMSNTGSGSAVAIMGQGMWKWSLLSPENQDLIGFYDAFWSNLVRWLIVGGDFQPGEQMAMKVDRTSVKKGDKVTASVVLKNKLPGGGAPQLQLNLPDGSSKVLPLVAEASSTPRYRAEFKTDQNGVHELKLTAAGITPQSLSQKLNVYELNEEKLDVAAQPMNLRIVADETGGHFYNWDEYDQFVSQVDSDLIAQKSPPETKYIWDHPLIMLLLLCWCGIEWIGRRKIGLI